LRFVAGRAKLWTVSLGWGLERVSDRIDSYFGRLVRRRRQMLGMTQLSLAEIVGVRFQQIQKYESGVNKLSAARLWMIAQALDVPVTYFYDGLKQMAAPTVAQPCNNSTELVASRNSGAAQIRVAAVGARGLREGSR
jgi:DNA-binding XRE family transcriptional regulator